MDLNLNNLYIFNQYTLVNLCKCIILYVFQNVYTKTDKIHLADYSKNDYVTL